MYYEIARTLIESGDVIALSHGGWTTRQEIESEIVRMATRSTFSHVGICWVVGGRVFVLEAVVPKVRVFLLSGYQEFYWLPMRKPLSKEALQLALSLAGQGYSRFEAVLSFFGIRMKDKLWSCAEYVKEVLSRNGVDISGDDTPSEVVKSCMGDFDAPLIRVRK